jgi:hypothetical protein
LFCCFFHLPTKGHAFVFRRKRSDQAPDQPLAVEIAGQRKIQDLVDVEKRKLAQV